MPCALHINGKFKHWPCDNNGYSPIKRHAIFEQQKIPCSKCGKLKAPNSKFCFKCTPRIFKYAGKHLPKKWADNVKKNNPWVWKGEKNPLWRGGAVDYSALHHWIRKQLGSPPECSRCGLKGERKTRAWNIQWANKSGLYQRTTEDWVALCPKCHASFDKGTIKRAVWNGKDMHLS